MNDQKLEKKIQNDVAEIRRDLNALMDKGVTKVTKGFDEFKSNAKETLSDTAESVKKGVENGLGQYNAKAQEYADKVPGDFGNMITKYPWVAITVGLMVGLLLGGLLKPSRKS